MELPLSTRKQILQAEWDAVATRHFQAVISLRAMKDAGREDANSPPLEQQITELEKMKANYEKQMEELT